jgi:hypothetical protein
MEAQFTHGRAIIWGNGQNFARTQTIWTYVFRRVVGGADLFGNPRRTQSDEDEYPAIPST